MTTDLYQQATDKRIAWETKLSRLQMKVDSLQAQLDKREENHQ